MQSGGGIGAAERGEAEGFGGGLRNIAGRWPDADVILQGGMSEGLRDWDLWGPLIFCLLLSLFLSWGAKGDQRDLVFSGVFALVWIGEAVVTLQIKLLGGNMYVGNLQLHWAYANTLQRVFPVCVNHRVHTLSLGHRFNSECGRHTRHCQDPSVSCSHRMVAGSWGQHHGRLRGGQESGRDCSIPAVCVLRCTRLPLLHQLKERTAFVRVCNVAAWCMAPGVSRSWRDSFVKIIT